jgi:hypothetical protein
LEGRSGGGWRVESAGGRQEGRRGRGGRGAGRSGGTAVRQDVILRGGDGRVAHLRNIALRHPLCRANHATANPGSELVRLAAALREEVHRHHSALCQLAMCLTTTPGCEEGYARHSAGDLLLLSRALLQPIATARLFRPSLHSVVRCAFDTHGPPLRLRAALRAVILHSVRLVLLHLHSPAASMAAVPWSEATKTAGKPHRRTQRRQHARCCDNNTTCAA